MTLTLLHRLNNHPSWLNITSVHVLLTTLELLTCNSKVVRSLVFLLISMALYNIMTLIGDDNMINQYGHI